MAWKAAKRWWPVLPVFLGLPVAAAATLSVSNGGLGAGVGTPASCDSGAPTVVQNVGTANPNTTNVVSVDVSGIASACGGGTVLVAVYNNTATAQEATTAIPAGGGSVNLTLTTPVALKEAHLVSVTLQGP
jgi:hypothetical protein